MKRLLVIILCLVFLLGFSVGAGITQAKWQRVIEYQRGQIQALTSMYNGAMSKINEMYWLASHYQRGG